MTTEQNKSPPHTPGPWWIDDDGFIAAGNGDTYVTIADFDCSNDIDIDEREANKSLALAAPELLAALEAILTHNEAHELKDSEVECEEDFCHQTAELETILDMARAGIAKARGRNGKE